MKKSKRNLIPKPEKLTAKERGIVQWIARFESGYRRKRIDTRFFSVWDKSEDVILCWLLFTAKPEGEWISRDGHLKQVFQSNV